MVTSTLPNEAEVARVFDSARLTQARVLAGLTRGELADRIGVSGAALGQYESAKMKPRENSIRLIAGILGVPVQFFAVGRPLVQIDPKTIAFRNFRRSGAKARAYTAAYAEQLWELTYALEKRVRFPDAGLPTIPDGTAPEQVARILRDAWGITGVLRNLVAVLESHGIIVNLAVGDFNLIEEVGTFSTVAQGKTLIVVAPQHFASVYRLRYVCAHELGHLLLHPTQAPGDRSQEDEADRFAVELLCPAADITPRLPGTIKFAALERLSTEWGVSVRFLVQRMGELGLATQGSVRRAQQRLNAAAGLRPIEPITTHPGEVPSLLLKALALATQHGTSQQVIEEELCWSEGRIRTLLNDIDRRPVLQL